MKQPIKTRVADLGKLVVLGLALLASPGCHERIENPAAEYPIPGREKNLGNVGELIYGPSRRPATISKRQLAPRTVHLSIPNSFFAEPFRSPIRNSKAGLDRASRLNLILGAFTEATGVKVVVVHSDPFSDETAQQPAAEIALVSDVDAVRLFSSATNRLEAWTAAEVPNAARVSPFYQDLLRAAADKSAPEGSARVEVGQYCLPYLWSLVGIGYHSLRTEDLPLSWQALFERQPVQGEIRFLNDYRLCVGSADLFMGQKLRSSAQGLRQVLDAGLLTSPDASRIKETEQLLRNYLSDHRRSVVNLRQVISRLIDYLQDKASLNVARQIGATTQEQGNSTNPPASTFTNSVAALKQQQIGQELALLRTNLDLAFGTAPAAELPLVPAPCKLSKNQVTELLRSFAPATNSIALNREDNAALQQYLSFGSPYEEVSTAAIRQSLALLLSYAQFLPSVTELRGQAQDLSDECVRTILESGAVLNLLKRQGFRLRSQESVFYDERSLGWRENPWTIVQLTGAWATYVQAQGVGQGTAALQPDPRKSRGIEFRLPEEGSIATVFSLVVLRRGQPEARPGVDRATWAVVNYLLRPEIASRLSEIFLRGSTEDDARAFVDRELLNSPTYALPEQFQRVQLAGSDTQTRIMFDAVGEELDRWFAEVHKSWDALRPAQRAGATAESLRPPRFPMGIDVHAGSDAAFHAENLF